MKANCDHCGVESHKEFEKDTIIWCLQCIFDNWETLKELGVSGSLPPAPGQTEDYRYTLPENINKLKSIPRKQYQQGQQIIIADPIVVEKQTEEKFDFDKYNSTLPGRGFE